MSWTQASTLVIDTETTGVDRQTDRIVELGAFGFVNGKLDEGTKFGTLINPGVPIPERAIAVHGITDDDVKDKPSFGTVAWRFVDRVKAASVLVGYNFTFDAEMITAELLREAERRALGGDGDYSPLDTWLDALKTKPILDPLVVVRLDSVGRYWKGKGRHKLDAVAQRLGVKRDGNAHRASSDAKLTAMVLHALASHLPSDAHEAAALIGRARDEQDAQFAAYRATLPKATQ